MTTKIACIVLGQWKTNFKKELRACKLVLSFCKRFVIILAPNTENNVKNLI